MLCAHITLTVLVILAALIVRKELYDPTFVARTLNARTELYDPTFVTTEDYYKNIFNCKTESTPKSERYVIRAKYNSHFTSVAHYFHASALKKKGYVISRKWQLLTLLDKDWTPIMDLKGIESDDSTNILRVTIDHANKTVTIHYCPEPLSGLFKLPKNRDPRKHCPVRITEDVRERRTKLADADTRRNVLGILKHCDDMDCAAAFATKAFQLEDEILAAIESRNTTTVFLRPEKQIPFEILTLAFQNMDLFEKGYTLTSITPEIESSFDPAEIHFDSNDNEKDFSLLLTRLSLDIEGAFVAIYCPVLLPPFRWDETQSSRCKAIK